METTDIMNIVKKIILSAALFLSATVQGLELPADTLLTNGGFESSDVNNGSWVYYTNSHNGGVNLGWDYGDSGMEIWDSLLGVVAIEGEQHAELNAHGANGQPYSFGQTFTTVIGQSYNYGFSYRARNNNNEEFAAGIVDIDWNIYDTHTTGIWSAFTGSFIATDIQSTISFTSRDSLGDTTGNLLDAVYVTAVPEPGSIALLVFGIAGLVVSRRLQNGK